jgi:putative ABC transport system permease protein
VTRISQFVFGGISAISLLVGSIGILNMMLITVNERVGEIGLRKALGATKYMILNQFLLEAIILTTIGGSLGVMVSFLALNGLVLLSPFQGIYFISLSTIFLVFIGCIFLGCISGAWPAWKAARMDPIAALQYEA